MKKRRVLYSATAKELIKKLPPSIKPSVKEGIDRLSEEPHTGKELIEELSGFRSLAVGKYRIVYSISGNEAEIEIHSAGHRRDVYMRFRELLGVKSEG